MSGASTPLVLAFLVVAACGRDKPEAFPVQQGESAAATPALTKTAPSSAAARPVVTPESAAGAELARATKVRTVQVASFPSAATARWWAQKLQGEGVPAYVTSATVAGAEVHRLRVGAALSGAEARALADRIRAQYRWPTWITMVDDRSVVTAGMLVGSRSYATGQ